MLDPNFIESISVKNTLYRDYYRMLLKLIAGLSGLALVLAAVLVYFCMFPRQANYYASTTGGENVALHAMNEPTVTNNFILRWAELAVRASLNFDFSKIDQQLQTTQTYYTADGWRAYQTTMGNNGLLKHIREGHLMSNAVINGTPVILGQEVVGGAYTWRVQVPVLITYLSGNDENKEKLIVNLLIERVPTLTAEKGILINSIATVTAAEDQKNLAQMAGEDNNGN